MDFTRQGLFLATVLCLLGILMPAAQVRAETLDYRVYLGPMFAGKITFESTTTATDYSVTAALKDSLPLVTFDDTMQVTGAVAKGQMVPAVYEQKMHENDYRAHKRVTYVDSAKKARFENLLDSAEKPENLKVPTGAVDTLTTLWRLRGLDLATIKQPIEQQVMGLKRAVNQTVTVGEVSRQKVREKNRMRLENLRRVTLSVTDEEKPDVNSVWHLYFRENATTPLVPVMFTTDTKYGAFAAYLQE